MHETEKTFTAACCESEPYNPKTSFAKGRKGKRFSMLDARNPIPSEISDSEDLQKLFGETGLVPYAGSDNATGESLLTWYELLAKLSHTHNACLRKKATYAFGGKAFFSRILNSDWDLGEEVQPIAPALQRQLFDRTRERLTFEGGVVSFHTNAAISYQKNGNCFVEVTVQNGENGFSAAHLKLHRTEHCHYVSTKINDPKLVCVSKRLNKAYIKKHGRYIPIFPVVNQIEGGYTTMFHLKNGDNDWYGRPETQDSDLYKYFEVAQALTLVKEQAGAFLGRLIIEVEDDDPKFGDLTDGDDPVSFADKFEENYTAKSEQPQAVMITNRPYGSRPMFVFQVAPNTNEAWYTGMGRNAAEFIRKSHKCTLRFMGEDAASGFSQDIVIADYIINMEPVINELRKVVGGFVNQIWTAVWVNFFGQPDMNEYSISFASPIDGAINEYKNRQNATGINSANIAP